MGKSEYLFVNLEKKQAENGRFNHYLVFRRDTGDLVFSFQNKANLDGLKDLDETAKGLRVLGLLPCEKVRKRTEKRKNMKLGDPNYEYGSEDENDVETEEDVEEIVPEDDG